jgi:phosphohistidine phosphatase SixA
MLETLIIVRHGNYQGSPESRRTPLSTDGRRKIVQLRATLLPYYQGIVAVCTSPFLRCWQTAELLAEPAQVQPEPFEELVSGGGVPADLPNTLELVRRKGAQASVVIVVAHLECVLGFPGYFGTQELDTAFKTHTPQYGQAYSIDCQAKLCILAE